MDWAAIWGRKKHKEALRKSLPKEMLFLEGHEALHVDSWRERNLGIFLGSEKCYGERARWGMEPRVHNIHRGPDDDTRMGEHAVFRGRYQVSELIYCFSEILDKFIGFLFDFVLFMGFSGLV